MFTKNDTILCNGSSSAIRTANKSIGTTIDIIIQLVRLLDGRYRVASIEEVTDTLGNDDSATIASI